MLWRTLAAAVVCLLWDLSGVAQNTPKGDAQLVQGSWDWDPAAKQSDAKPVILLERVVIKGDMLTFHYNLDGKKSTSPTKFKLDSTASPKRLDFTPTGGSNKGKTYLGLYEVKPQHLKICYRGPGSTRPKDFNDKLDGNDGTVFIVLKLSGR
jgi:uncharacterized protein (TIGR03067 family)